ncbi:thymidine phosphorylase, partial [Corynebacterium variabile]
VTTTALLTDMFRPLGRTVGNALEVREAVEVLAGGGPEDVVELTVALAREMLTAVRVDADPADALCDGRAMDSWRAMVTAQGGDPDSGLPTATHTHEVTADRDGWLTHTDALAFGVASWRLGAGRARKEDPVQAGAGIELHTVVGEWVRAGQPLFSLHTDDPARFDRALASLEDAWTVTGEEPEPRESVVLERIGD